MRTAHLNLRLAEWRLWHTQQLELTQVHIVAGLGAVASVDHEGHVGLVVMHRGEHLFPVAGSGQGGRQQHMVLQGSRQAGIG